MQAIILAGGFGTRLQSVVPDAPKCMALVNHQPFINYIIQLSLKMGVTHFIFALGYKSEMVIAHLKNNYANLSYEVSIENTPLGTGGAILQAIKLSDAENILVMNGDTIFNIDLDLMNVVHLKNKADCTLALKPLENFNRYGVVELSDNNKVTGFLEKKQYQKGLINGGVYLLNKTAFLNLQLPMIFSFEKEFLEIQAIHGNLYGVVQDGYFIDIGIPEDFEKANRELSLALF